jgi:hypothetical protein
MSIRSVGAIGARFQPERISKPRFLDDRQPDLMGFEVAPPGFSALYLQKYVAIFPERQPTTERLMQLAFHAFAGI